MALNFSQKFFRVPLWGWTTILVMFMGGGLGFVLTQPDYATWRYGACRVFLEQYVRFPQTISIRQGGETRGTAYISFSDRNPYGAEQIKVFECHYSNDQRTGIVLSRVTVDRKSLPDDMVKKFAAQLPLLAGQELDNALPHQLPSDLIKLKD